MHMTYPRKSIEAFLDQLAFDTDFYDVLTTSELLEFTKDFLSNYDIIITEGCDYRNDQNKNGNYYCDLASEYADRQVDVYYGSLWEKAPKFQWWVEDALNEFWFDKSRGMIGLLQMGQYLFYSRLTGHILNNLSDYAKA